MKFDVVVEKRAIEDIQEAIDYYNIQKAGLGKKFEQEVDKYLNTLVKTPLFQIRYKNVRGLPLKKFPFMIHFSVDNEIETVLVHAVLHTSENPDNWNSRA